MVVSTFGLFPGCQLQALVDQMKSVDQLNPDQVTHNIMIHAWAKQGQVLEAQEWLKRMRPAGLRPNEISYASALLACTQEGNVDVAEELMKCMVEAPCWFVSRR